MSVSGGRMDFELFDYATTCDLIVLSIKSLHTNIFEKDI